MKVDDLTIEIVEKAIGIPARKWTARCFEIACLIVRAKLVDGVPVYGHYKGPVATTGFWAERRGQSFQRHGWIVLDDDRILDPTRWSFEDKDPYLHLFTPPDDSVALCETCDHVDDEHERGGFFSPCAVADCDCDDFVLKRTMKEYDEGGNGLREAMLMPPPKFHKGEKVENLPVRGDAKAFVMTLLGRPEKITRAMLFWLANLPVKKLGEFAPDVYRALIKSDNSALIPIDNRRMVLGSYG